MTVRRLKVFVFILLFNLLIENAKTQQRQCQQEIYLSAQRQRINFTSPNYPAAYRAGSNCRYKIIAPMDHIVIVNCQYEVYPNSCSTEYFYLSRDGDFQFRDGESFCRSGTIRSSSHYRAIVLGYFSRNSATNQRGRFFCEAFIRRQQCDCGWSLSSRIVNGEEARINEYPFMVALREITSSQRQFCGGTIISHRHILTAAHCTNIQSDPRKIIAYVGDHDLTSTTESIFAIIHRIRQIILHPNFASLETGTINDIAIFVTTTAIEWSRGVGPICLPIRLSSELFTNVNVDVIGWGTTSFGGLKSGTLQKVQLMTIDNRVCQQQHNITASHICTQDYRGLGRDSCQYDSGGPVIYRHRQRMYFVGIISYGGPCGVEYAISVNTRVTTHLNWIWRHVGNNICIL